MEQGEADEDGDCGSRLINLPGWARSRHRQEQDAVRYLCLSSG